MNSSERTWVFEPVLASPLDGELDGPAWDGERLLICQPDRNEILRVDPSTGAIERFRHSTCGTRGLALGPDGRLYGAQARSRRVVWFEESGATYSLNAMLEGRRHNDPQDLVVDGAGHIWFSDDWTEASTGGPVGWPPLDHRSVLRLTRTAETDDRIGDWALERMTYDTVAPHGLGLDRARAMLYLTDRGDVSTPPTLRAYSIEGDRLGPGRIVHDFAAEAGDRTIGDVPGGLCVDAGGRIIVAVGGGPGGGAGSVAVFEPIGRLAGSHPVPAGTPTNCALGGPDGRMLYVSTAEGAIFSAAVREPRAEL